VEASSGGSADSRLDERSNVFLSATMHGSSGAHPVRIRNISTLGAMLDGRDLPEEGCRITLRRGQLVTDAEVAWQSGEFRGIRFSTPVEPDAWIKRVGHSGQQRVDKAVAALRVGMVAAAATLGEASESRSVADLSEELVGICERMASSPNLSVELGEDVLKVEAIAVSLRKLSSSA
jgi:hypothetical protein